ncbi:MAG TPA: SsrA-binding protein SmpB [Candidatus Olsenella pullistercoris]|uniref:SsrA-binding protein n=1 Tax=Candidatus Olsenella pullistercoris TaxID=2838712 RepID=A0A9D2EZZ6_9ACTN|nr:SsrA-binding protein SmpB [Candidatus Olsenella pullistercoris]
MAKSKVVRQAAAAAAKQAGPGKRTIAKNRSARHEYFIDETFEAGIELTGTEVKSLRERACQLTDAFCLIRAREAWLHGVHIHPYSNGGVWNVDPDRKRRLLLHRRQIDYLDAKLRQRGLALVPLEIYFDGHNRVKLTIGLARGKKLYDKRADIARRDSDREIARVLKERNR